MKAQSTGVNDQNNLNSNSPIVYPPIQNTAASYQMPLPQAPNIVYVKDPMSELNNCTGVTIKQQPELF